MLDLRVLENLSLSCFLGSSKKKKNDKQMEQRMYRVSNEYNISILPIQSDFDIENLYPITDHVEVWNIFVVGNDKTYILANVKDPNIYVPNSSNLLNHKSENILPTELHNFFDTLWDNTLSGKQLQFYMVWNSRLYLLNSYPLYNGKKSVIGATLFMRQFDSPVKNPQNLLQKIDKKDTKKQATNVA